MKKAIFIDRDGTLNKMVVNDDHGHIDSPFSVRHFVLAEGAKEFVKAAQQKGYLVVVVSNQPSVAKGTLRLDSLNDMTLLMCKELGIPADQVYYCMHKSDDNCDCRKPKVGMLKRAAAEHDIDLKESLFVGDGWNDIAAGKSVGVRKTILIGRKDRTELINHLVDKQAMPDAFAKDLHEASKLLEVG